MNPARELKKIAAELEKLHSPPDEIVLSGYTFKKVEELPDRDLIFYDLQGKYEGAFYVALKPVEKFLSVNLCIGCSASDSTAVVNQRRWFGDLYDLDYDNEEDRKKLEDLYALEHNLLYDIWDEIAKDAKKKFPNYIVKQES